MTPLTSGELPGKIRRGRRPAGEATRAAILDAARTEFLEPIVRASTDEIVALVAPTLQRYLAGRSD